LQNERFFYALNCTEFIRLAGDKKMVGQKILELKEAAHRTRQLKRKR
jgi:hypothetical protein